MSASEEIRIERTYDAPAEVVWELWSTPAGIESWWAPDGFRVEVQTLDLQPGGELIYTMTATAPEQVEFMRNAGLPLTTKSRKTFTEIQAPTIHRGGCGPPLVCLHGFTGTWRMWELVLPALERHYDVLALTLPGYAGAPPLPEPITDEAIYGALERTMDGAGIRTAHIVGNSLGGYLALGLAARDRAQSVVAFAPAGGWAAGDDWFRQMLNLYAHLQAFARMAIPTLDAILATADGRRRATAMVAAHHEHIPPEVVAHLILGTACCSGLRPMVDYAVRAGYRIDAERIRCPVRVVWGTEDELLPWPSGAARYREDLLPHADWVVLDGVGHCPQLDSPTETVALIREFAS